MKRTIRILTSVMLSIAFLAPALAAEYIQITKEKANIRAAASTNSAVVGTALKGDIFVLEAEEGAWYRVFLFSGDSRFIYKTLAEKVEYKPILPEDEVLSRTVFNSSFESEAKAKAEADKRYPPEKNLNRNLSYFNLLQDKYKLEMMQMYELPTADYRRIMIEGNFQGWPR